MKSTVNFVKFNVNQLNKRLQYDSRFKKHTGKRPSLSVTRKDGSIIELSTINHDEHTTWMLVSSPDGTLRSEIVYIIDLQCWNGHFKLMTVKRNDPEGHISIMNLD